MPEAEATAYVFCAASAGGFQGFVLLHLADRHLDPPGKAVWDMQHELWRSTQFVPSPESEVSSDK